MPESGSVAAFAHVAVLEMEADADARAPGGAITLALCGAYDHAPPCPLAAHYTGVESDAAHVELRVLFATALGNEQRVRDLIAEALAAGAFAGPDGLTSRWRLVTAGPSDVRPAEYDHAQRLRDSTATRTRLAQGERLFYHR